MVGHDCDACKTLTVHGGLDSEMIDVDQFVMKALRQSMKIFFIVAELPRPGGQELEASMSKQVRRRITEPGLGDRGHQAVGDQEQRHRTPDAPPMGHGKQDQNDEEGSIDDDPEPSLVQIDSEPVAVDRKAIEGLVGQSRSEQLLQPGALQPENGRPHLGAPSELVPPRATALARAR